jgi:hypothetical protein
MVLAVALTFSRHYLSILSGRHSHPALAPVGSFSLASHSFSLSPLNLSLSATTAAAASPMSMSDGLY